MKPPISKSAGAACGHAGERGFALVFVAAGMSVILFLCALAVDAGLGYLTRARMSRAVDAAALAAAKFSGQGVAAMQAAAEAIGAANFSAATFTTSVSTDANDVTVVRVEGRRTIPTVFGHIAGINSFDTAAGAEVTRYPLDLSLVLDVSSSMVASGSFTIMKDGAKTFVDLFDEARDQLGVVSFATVATEAYPIQKNFKVASKAAIDALTGSADTNTMHGIQLGRTQLQGAPIRGSGTGQRRVVLVLFTDGLPTAVTDPYTNVVNRDVACPVVAPKSYTGAIAAGASPGSPIRGLAELGTPGNLRRLFCLQTSGAPTTTTNLFPSPYSPLPGLLPNGDVVTQANGDTVRAYAKLRAREEARAARAINSVIYVIGLGNPAAMNAWQVPDQDLLRKIANENGVEDTGQTKGQMFFAPDNTMLQLLFEQVATRILTRVTM